MHKIKQIVLWALRYPQILRNCIYCHCKGVRPDVSWRFYGLPVIHRGGDGRKIIIGVNFSAVSDNRHNSYGIIQPVVIKTVDKGARIKIGDDVGVSGCTISAAESIVIGNRVLIGSGAIIVDNDAHPIDPIARRRGGGGRSAPITIEDDVFIGARAIVLKGVTIGRGSVVGAGAVVTRSVPAFSIVVGNPARVVGDSRRTVQ